ncbi:MAG: 16S rRNA (guanine(527)-N(7))-methyltransferase RsmG [Clostridia bacterium]|nr:16S rRNA (guanine(527)-N(7))-methyltransferase RsmG [Clostridia bacterium]
MISEILEKWCAENNILISDTQKQKFETYAKLLLEWNEKINLTAITEDTEVAVKHFIDSITLLKYADIKENASVIDIGTGAGFPGIPLKIMRDDINLTLLDSLNKRLVFLDEVCNTIDIKAQTVHSRAEEGGQNPKFREKYDVAVSRAVANLPALCEYCMPYVKVGGVFVSMKGSDGENELENAKNAISVLGGKIENCEKLTLPDGSTRTIITIKKINPIPQKYPRRSVKINKQPL